MPFPFPISETWIVNAAPFIGLAKIGRLELLIEPDRAIFLPETVVHEIRAGRRGDAAVEALAQITAGESTIQGITLLPRIALDSRLSRFALDAGEAAVLTEALIREASVCVIDDRPGRAAAKALGLDVTGTVGVLLQARQEGRLTALAPELRGLQAAGLYLPREDILRELLAGMGEDWP